MCLLFESSVNMFNNLTKKVELLNIMSATSTIFQKKIINLSNAVKRKGNKNVGLREKIAELCQKFR